MVCTKVTRTGSYKAGWTEAVMETPQEAVGLEQLYSGANEEVPTRPISPETAAIQLNQEC